MYRRITSSCPRKTEERADDAEEVLHPRCTQTTKLSPARFMLLDSRVTFKPVCWGSAANVPDDWR